jgi:hypothetical protein
MSDPERDETQWRCLGCGKEAPGKVKQCDCPTRVVGRHNYRETTWCVEDPAETFAKAVAALPGLALAAGMYVGIKVYASKEQAEKMGDL